MPRIDWPRQSRRITEACGRHGVEVPAEATSLLALPAARVMGAPEAKAFLACFYAARDLERAERDLAGGVGQTGEFAARALSWRVGELRQHIHELEALLCRPGGRAK
jgi:hypothetical protein